MKNGVFWDVTPCGRLLVTASVVPSSSETSVLTRVARRNIPEDVILHTNNVSSNYQPTHAAKKCPVLDLV
jgi:hypothetical protein